MDGTYNENEVDRIEVICCFCGKSLLMQEAMVIDVQSNTESDEIQRLYCHRNHFIEKLDKSVNLYIDE